MFEVRVLVYDVTGFCERRVVVEDLGEEVSEGGFASSRHPADKQDMRR